MWKKQNFQTSGTKYKTYLDDFRAGKDFLNKTQNKSINHKEKSNKFYYINA